jgi:hypothetical protein
MPSAAPSPTRSPVLGAVLRVMSPLVRWLLRSGVGYTEFSAALKPVFLEEAQKEVLRTGGKPTDSALSLLSGLHRKDIKKIAEQGAALHPLLATAPGMKASLASQVVTRWLASGLPDSLPLMGEASFETMARSVSVDVHPRTVLAELQRLGIVSVDDATVSLLRHAFVADPSTREAQALVAHGVADHAAAGVHNLTSGQERQYLEQAVFADGLTQASARQLEILSTQLWNDVMTHMVQAAVPLCEADEALGGDYRLRVGMYCFAAPMAQPEKNSPLQPEEQAL